MSMGRVAGYALLFAVGLAGWLWLAQSEPLRFGANADPQPLGPARLAYGFLVTLAGVFLGSAFRELKRYQIEQKRRKIRPLSFFAGVLRSVDFWMGVCAAPIVYALIIRNLDGGGDAGLTVIALENGFCCVLIASQILEPPGGQTD